MIVFVKKTGGQLGNRLFAFAHIYAFCLEHRYRLMHIGFEEYAAHFENTRTGYYVSSPQTSEKIVAPFVRNACVRMLRFGMSALGKLPLKSVASVSVGGEGEPFPLDDKKFQSSLRDKKLLRLEGFVLRANSSFHKYSREIRAFLVPTKEIRERVQQAVCEARKEADVLIGVHIRRGDYKGFQGGKFYFEIEEYATLMRRTADLFPNKRVRFLVCSNETLTAEQFAGLSIAFGPGQLVEDLYALAACDYLVGTHSTFVMWASFYGQVPLYRFDDPARIPVVSDFRSNWS